MSDNTILEAKSVSKQFGGLAALQDLSFTLSKGEILSIIGPNGAGKTTFFNCVTGLGSPTAGDIVFGTPQGPGGTRSIARLPAHQITRLGIARTFQNIRLFAEMSALENVMVGMHCRTGCGVLAALTRHQGMVREEKAITEAALELLHFVRLVDEANTWARNMAYGDQRRLEIARALATQPQLLCLDEPGAGMNPAETNELMNLIRKIRDKGITVLLIEHHMKVVMGISDRVIVLDHGVKISEGCCKDVQCDPKVIEAYLGKDHKVQ